MITYHQLLSRFLFIAGIICSSVHAQSPTTNSHNLIRDYYNYGKIDAQSYRHQIIHSIKPYWTPYVTPNICWIWAPSCWEDQEYSYAFNWAEKRGRDLFALVQRAKDQSDEVAFRALIAYFKGYLNDCQSKNIAEEIDRSRSFGEKLKNGIFPIFEVDEKIAHYKKRYAFIIRALKKLIKAKNFNELKAAATSLDREARNLH